MVESVESAKMIHVCLLHDSADDARDIGADLQQLDDSLEVSHIKSKVALRKAVRNHECDVVVGVPGIPRFDAYKAAKTLAKLDSNAPVIGLAKPDSDADVVEAMESGLVDLVQADDREHLRLVILRELDRNRLPSAVDNTRDFTGVYSRLHFLDLLDQAVENYVADTDEALGLVYIQLDSFSWINENIGIAPADRYLSAIAEVIGNNVGERDVPARYHGGTFVVLISADSINELQDKAESLASAIGDYVFEYDNQAVSSTCSIGLSLVTDITENTQELVAHAFLACEDAKASGGNNVQWYGVQKTAKGKEADPEAWIMRIRRAFENDMFTLLFQPIISLAGHQKPRYEVLLRMLNDEGDTILPGAFLPFAERAGLMADIDRWVVTNAISSAQDLMRSGIEPEIYLKLSGKALTDKTMPSWIKHTFEERRCPGEVIVFEITESLAITHPAQTRMLISVLKQLGCLVALDHFGTRQRSLRVMDELDIDYVKIDGTLIREISKSEMAKRQVKQIVDRASRKGVGTIAESVQDASSLPIIWQYGIECIQGYFLQEPDTEMRFDFSQVAL